MWLLVEISAFFFVLAWILGLLRCIQMQISGDVCEIWAVFYVWGVHSSFSCVCACGFDCGGSR